MIGECVGCEVVGGGGNNSTKIRPVSPTNSFAEYPRGESLDIVAIFPLSPHLIELRS